MSDQSTLVSAEHFRYIAEHTVAEDAFLRDLKREATAAGIPAIWIAPEQASLVQILLRLARVRQVVEVGTLAGYSAIVMARALPADGRVRTIEIDPKHAEFARRWIARSDVAGKVEVLVGAGAEVLPGLDDGTADAVFLDADKGSYPLYLAHGMRLLREGGLVMVDNAFAFGELFSETPRDREVAAVRAFNEHMKGVRGLQSVIVPLGDGVWVGVKLAD
jgi:predicted O-methyltransferase YrrM